MKVVGVYSIKGGVGKTNVSVALARVLRDGGWRVGVLDADLTGANVPTVLGLERPEADRVITDDGFEPVEHEGIRIMSMAFFDDDESAIIWKGEQVADAVMDLYTLTNWGPLDVLIVDMPPTSTDTAIRMVEVIKDGGFILVTTPQKEAVEDLRRTIDFLEYKKRRIYGVIVNMAYLADEEGRPKAWLGSPEAVELLGVPVLATIPFFTNGKNLEAYLDRKSLEKALKLRRWRR